jgi:3-hydroxyisobutyrate dehydrogenase-like beta-hydroxyacid dehydrogenase
LVNTIGFIGLGRMGGPMCRHLVRKSGARVLVFDPSPAAVAACVEEGAQEASDLAALASSSEVIFSSLPMPHDVESVVLGPGGIAASARPGTVYIDLSTSAPDLAQRLAETLAETRVTMLDAPVSGSPPGAEAGTLAVMVGGDESAFEAHRPLLECFGAHIIHLGPVGSGLVAKLTNNLIALCGVATACEALMLGVSAGLDARRLDRVIRSASGDSIAYRALADRALSGDYTPSFTLDLSYKDIHLALELADRLSVPLPMGTSLHNLMRMARGLGLGDNDPTAMVRVYETLLQRDVAATVAA